MFVLLIFVLISFPSFSCLSYFMFSVFVLVCLTPVPLVFVFLSFHVCFAGFLCLFITMDGVDSCITAAVAFSLFLATSAQWMPMMSPLAVFLSMCTSSKRMVLSLMMLTTHGSCRQRHRVL